MRNAVTARADDASRLHKHGNAAVLGEISFPPPSSAHTPPQIPQPLSDTVRRGKIQKRRGQGREKWAGQEGGVGLRGRLNWVFVDVITLLV